MTVHDALATLHEARDWIVEDDPGEADTGGFHAALVTRVDAALTRVEAEIARLETERDQWKMHNTEAYERAVAAEAENARLTVERDEAIERAQGYGMLLDSEVARLRDGLRRIAEIPTGAVDDGMHPRDIARALLSGEDGAAKPAWGPEHPSYDEMGQ